MATRRAATCLTFGSQKSTGLGDVAGQVPRAVHPDRHARGFDSIDAYCVDNAACDS